MQQTEFTTLSVGIGATIWFAVYPQRSTPMKLLLGLIAIAFLVYGISSIILEGLDMKIPLWVAIVLGGLVGGLAAGFAWNQHQAEKPKQAIPIPPMKQPTAAEIAEEVAKKLPAQTKKVQESDSKTQEKRLITKGQILQTKS